jgi:hypothetical protein
MEQRGEGFRKHPFIPINILKKGVRGVEIERTGRCLRMACLPAYTEVVYVTTGVMRAKDTVS